MSEPNIRDRLDAYADMHPDDPELNELLWDAACEIEKLWVAQWWAPPPDPSYHFWLGADA